MKERSWRNSKLAILLAIGLVCLIALIAAWKLSSVDHLARGSSDASFVIRCDFDKYRQIMVRKNATGAIVSHGGMKLIGERIKDLELDATADDRPLLNALRGKSKTEVSAIKELTVQLNDPDLDADQLVLQQHANIREQVIDVRTSSVGPAGRLESYETTLHAEPDPEGTRISLTVQLSVWVTLPVLFKSRADASVQEAAEKAIAGQEVAMQQFVMQHAEDRFILPDLSR